MALLFASNLEVRDLIKQARKEEAWTIPDALQVRNLFLPLMI